MILREIYPARNLLVATMIAILDYLLRTCWPLSITDFELPGPNEVRSCSYGLNGQRNITRECIISLRVWSTLSVLCPSVLNGLLALQATLQIYYVMPMIKSTTSKFNEEFLKPCLNLPLEDTTIASLKQLVRTCHAAVWICRDERP